MEIVLSQFIKALAESGLMTADQVRGFLDSLPPETRPDDGAALARKLVRRGKLTKFQAQAIYQGKTKGLILGDYVVLDRIGQGGMGQVYKAQHRTMERIVALKTLPSAATKSKRAIQRFHREVKVAARLSHPNIVTAHDAGESHGVHYLVMEYVQGADLARLVRTHRRLPVRTAVDYVLQAARGLEYAHSEGVIHRDIKPSNLLLDPKGTVKVLDMGLARLIETVGPYDPTAEETLTGTGQAMGTIDYMPPEQAENTKTVDQRADVYSLGCTLYFLLAGKSTYSGDTTVQKLLAHREAPIPSLRAERDDVPEMLDRVFQKMVAKRPQDRYPSMTQVIAELAQCIAPRPEELAETVGFEGDKLADAAVPTLPVIETGRPADESLPLDLPVVSPVDDFLRARPMMDKKQQIIIASVAVGIAIVLLLLGVIVKIRTPDGTLLVEVNEPDATVSVLDEEGKVEITRPTGGAKLSISVDPGKHRLKVEKDGFQFFTQDFVIESGGTTRIRARLAPLPVSRAVPDTGAGASPGVGHSPTYGSPDEARRHQEAWAKQLGAPVEMTNPIGMEFRLIPPGEFQMGSSQEEIDQLLESTANEHLLKRFRSEGPRHRVSLTRPFYLAVYEVTQEEYEQVMGANPSHFSSAGDGKDKVAGQSTNRHPVEMVSWLDAVHFCNKLSAREKRRPCYVIEGDNATVVEGNGYRLATEAEWEYACRAGSEAKYCFGDSESGLEQYAWCGSHSGRMTHPVGEKLPNGFGLYDMHGNVWEWCRDWDEADYYAQSSGNDPTGPSVGAYRVRRGGSWHDRPGYCRSAYRRNLPPTAHNHHMGFRVALDPADE